MSSFAKIFFQGVLIGIANIIPGLSGGTVAVIIGVYSKLIDSISSFSFSWFYQKNDSFNFLLLIFFGAGFGIFSFSFVLNYLFVHFFEILSFFLLGTVVSSVPFLFKQEKGMSLSIDAFFVFLLCFSVTLLFVLFQDFSSSDLSPDFSSNASLFMITLSGVLASSAMIIPGISGSLILLICGTYSTVVASIKSLDIVICFLFGLGFLCGLLTTSKLIQLSLKNYCNITCWGIIGLICGTLPGLYPGIQTKFLFYDLIFFLLGFSLLWIPQKR